MHVSVLDFIFASSVCWLVVEESIQSKPLRENKTGRRVRLMRVRYALKPLIVKPKIVAGGERNAVLA
jgi:hypothetical protein